MSSRTAAAYPPSATGSAPGVAITIPRPSGQSHLVEHVVGRPTSRPGTAGSCGPTPRPCAATRRPAHAAGALAVRARPGLGDRRRTSGSAGAAPPCGRAERPCARAGSAPARGRCRTPGPADSRSAGACTSTGPWLERSSRTISKTRRGIRAPASAGVAYAAPGRTRRSTCTWGAARPDDGARGASSAHGPAATRPGPAPRPTARCCRPAAGCRLADAPAAAAPRAHAGTAPGVRRRLSSPSSQIATRPRSRTGAKAAARVPTHDLDLTPRRPPGRRGSARPGRGRPSGRRTRPGPSRVGQRRRRRGRTSCASGTQMQAAAPGRQRGGGCRGHAVKCPVGTGRRRPDRPRGLALRRAGVEEGLAADVRRPGLGQRVERLGRARPRRPCGSSASTRAWRGGTASRSTSASVPAYRSATARASGRTSGSSTGSRRDHPADRGERTHVIGRRRPGRPRSRRRRARRTGP